MPDRRTQWASALALVGLAVAGCAGPAAPLDVGTQAAPISLVLGELKAVDSAPIGPVSAPPMPWTRPYYQPPVGVPLPPSLPPLPTLPCPDFDPLSPVLGVGRAIQAPPVKATYRYRAQIIESYAGKAGGYIGDTVWTVEPGPVDQTTGAYDVTYTVTAGKSVTKRVFRTFPHDVGQPDSEPSDQTNVNTQVIQTANGLLTNQGLTLPSSLPNYGTYGLAGIYLVSQEANGVAFRPTVPIALLQLRQLTGATDKTAQNASSISSVGVDPVSQAVMAFRSTVVNPANKLNACGTKLESVQVALSSVNSPDTAVPQNPGSFVLPDLGAAMYVEKVPSTDATRPKSNVMLFSEKLDFGLQYGGLLLADEARVMPTGLMPNGVQVDSGDPPTATPSGAPPTDPSKPLDTGLWAATPVITWALEHMIIKQVTFVINEKPKFPKVS